MSEREAREIEPGYYAYHYSEEEIREITEEMPEGLEFLEKYLDERPSYGRLERFLARLFSRW